MSQQKAEKDYQQLTYILSKGDLKDLKQHLLQCYSTESNIKYDRPLKDGWTLMLHAVLNLQFDMLQYLISNGANVNCQAGKFRS